MREVLFNDLKLSAKGLKKTKSGFSTDADTLEKLAAVHPLPRKLIEYRGLAKLKSTYRDALPPLIDPVDGRIHTLVSSGADRHRPAELDRSQPAEYPHPQRSGTPDSPGLRAATRNRAAVGGLFAD